MARRNRTSRPSFVFIFFFIFFSVCIGAGAGVLTALYKNMPRLEYFDYKPSLTTKIYDINGELIADLYYIENRVRIPISQIPDNLRNAILAIEDERFFDHHGIDFRSLFRAIVVDIKEGGRAQGGSTITQQLAKNAFLTHEKTFTRKILEALLAIQLERKYTKIEILELYLNEIYFGISTVTVPNTFVLQAIRQPLANSSSVKNRFSSSVMSEMSPKALTLHLPHRPFPPQTASISSPTFCAALRII